ncbi:ferrochelatase [Denitratisoma sp. DHT3]|uniref:ferrochelatase n=1 Tax=Denitratisoma sp. DHT3 TaxID=1981880 RepID=UPI0011983BD8|nr:ferrochelatase [Denitratisoma sp. DHT3]QDX80669.1 ferrochelatase [Denitratisoma sp. DHT3]
MPRFLPEPPHRHGGPARTAVLLVNLGTPEAPTAPALRRYLKEFLADPRVVEIPRWAWWPILHGIILNTRPSGSARKYAQIWLKEGSPLQVHTERQAKLLQGLLGQQGHAGLKVAWAMRYGQPSVPAALSRLKAEGARRILIVPLYPQYAASTTASVMDCAAQWMQASRNLPELRWVRHFHDHPGYIAALAGAVREHWQGNGRAEKLVISFHGTPRRSLDLGDPYHCECQKTGRLLAQALGLNAEQYAVTFQSRFGRARWLQPYTQPTLERLAREGVKRVDVICPGFVADCLETLEEVAMECKAAFLAAGGRDFHYIPCLNERPDWIAALSSLVRQHLGHWQDLPEQEDGATHALAQALGAQD